MSFEVKILADSLAPSGCRLTTMEWTFPRSILAEVNTHRKASKNAASSRAIPTPTLIRRVIDEPFIPDFRVNQKGMQAGEALEDDDAIAARVRWLSYRDAAVEHAQSLHSLNIHKQYINRLLEPWMWCTIIISATDWGNLFALRCDAQAEPSFHTIADMALAAMRGSTPAAFYCGQWHLPLTTQQERMYGQPQDWRMISAGRCARVSYLTHGGERDLGADVALAERLLASGHMSPFEHQASALDVAEESGNFVGWRQFRKTLDGENRSFAL